YIWFVSNRRIRGLWQSSIPSRFIDELPASHVEVVEGNSNYGGYGNSGTSRFDTSDPFENTYSTPGWNRAKSRSNTNTKSNWGTRSGPQTRSNTIEGELIASSIHDTAGNFELGDRVFHLKFGNGNITLIDGNKLTIAFDKAGEKRVLASFVEAT
ncbi:MAG: ATP-dependent DNA helicase, partial [Rhizobiaceae bacterium]|nr:ATP-dependent DNA helicase [Rhizobiaceae bacterium]